MDSVNPNPDSGPAPGEPDVTIEKVKTLLKTKDDTTRFVGLALLKSILDNNERLVDDQETLRGVWESLSPKFLDRLLHAHGNKKLKAPESQAMVDVAVSVLHKFSMILPEVSRRDERLTARISPLLAALVKR
jgi:hypothetical protein